MEDEKVTKVDLKPFACPVCKGGNLVKIQIDESVVTEAPRHPVIITAICSKKHTLAVFVDSNFQVRDIEATMSVASGEDEGDAVDKTKSWFDSL